MVGTISNKKTFSQAFINFGDAFHGIQSIIHEMGHVFGAYDLYGTSGICKYPEGYVEPDKEPLYPQSKACLRKKVCLE